MSFLAYLINIHRIVIFFFKIMCITTGTTFFRILIRIRCTLCLLYVHTMLYLIHIYGGKPCSCYAILFVQLEVVYACKGLNIHIHKIFIHEHNMSDNSPIHVLWYLNICKEVVGLVALLDISECASRDPLILHNNF